MKKIIIFILISVFFIFDIFPIVEENSYHDIGLVEKNGTYGFDSYLRKSSITLFTSVGTDSAYDPSTGKFTRYNELGARIKILLDMPELKGFYFNGDFMISRNSLSIYTSGDLAWWNSYVPWLGETYFGYKNKYFNVSFGFQNLVSSDAIYNHLGLDDYSGSLPALRIRGMLGRFVDFDLMYVMVRPNQSPWYNGSQPISVDPVTQNDPDLYDGMYGKTLYTHKINIRPLPWVRVGVYEETFFVGENINPWYANPFFTYIASQFLDNVISDKAGNRLNTNAANLMAGVDYNIGFNGWRTYGEFLLDDSNGEYFKFENPSHPDKFGFDIGFELRGYLLTKNFKLSGIAEYIIGNMYVNFEYGIVSNYTYSRDSNYNYEFVRDEYKYRYDNDNPPSQDIVDKENRVGNFLGFMYGPNSDCIDIAIGWRSDLYDVKEYTADYQADVYFQSFKKRMIPKRLFKMQLHFRNYRLGDGRNVILPYYGNQNPSYWLTPEEIAANGGNPEKSTIGTSNGTDFLSHVVEIGDVVDLNFYGDIIKLSRFVLGMETKFAFTWTTYNPFLNYNPNYYVDYYKKESNGDWTLSSMPYNFMPGSDHQFTTFQFKWDFAIIISW